MWFLGLVRGHRHGGIQVHKLHGRGKSSGHAERHLGHLDRTERFPGHPRLLILLSGDVGNGRGEERGRIGGGGSLRRRRRFAPSPTAIVVIASMMGAHAPDRVVSAQGICVCSPCGKATPKTTASTLGSIGAGRQVHVVAASSGKGDWGALGSAISVNVEEG